MELQVTDVFRKSATVHTPFHLGESIMGNRSPFELRGFFILDKYLLSYGLFDCFTVMAQPFQVKDIPV